MNQADAIYKAIKERAVKFTDCHDVHTPRELVNEILVQIPLTGKILVLFNVEFVISLVYDFNVDPKNIVFYSDSVFKSKMMKRVGAFIITTLDTNMKFDVIVGNPPYHNPNNNKRMLWNEFLDRCLDLVVDNGIIAMISPATWLWSKTNIHNSYLALEDYQVQKAVIYARGDTPFNVGSSISYYIIKKVERTAPTPLYCGEWSLRSETFIDNVDIKNEKVWPGEVTPINVAIHKKLQQFPKIEFEKSCEFHNQKLKKKNMVSDVKTADYAYTHHVSAAIVRFTNTKFSKHNQWKVMVPLTSTINKAVIDKDCGHGEDMLTLYVENEQVARNIQQVFQTDAFKFIGRLYKFGRNQPLQGIFPQVDFSKNWTSEELYDLFGFTPEEKEYANTYC